MRISDINTERKEDLKFQDPKIQFTDKELWSRFRYFWKVLNPLQEFKETEASTTFYPDQKLILDALVKRLKYRHEINGHQQL